MILVGSGIFLKFQMKMIRCNRARYFSKKKTTMQKQPPYLFCKKGVLGNFTKFKKETIL